MTVCCCFFSHAACQRSSPGPVTDSTHSCWEPDIFTCEYWLLHVDILQEISYCENWKIANNAVQLCVMDLCLVVVWSLPCSCFLEYSWLCHSITTPTKMVKMQSGWVEVRYNKWVSTRSVSSMEEKRKEYVCFGKWATAELDSSSKSNFCLYLPLQSPQPKPDNNPVLEHSLHQLLRQVHFKNKYHPMPYPASALLGMSKRRRLAGPQAHTRADILDSMQRYWWIRC